MNISDIRSKMQDKVDDIVNECVDGKVTISDSKNKFGVVLEEMILEIATLATSDNI